MRFAALLILMFATNPVLADMSAGSFTLANFQIAPDSVTVVGTFSPFDTSLGTLRSVMINTGGTDAAVLTLSNLEPGGYVYGVHAEYSLLAPLDIVLSSVKYVVGGRTLTVFTDGTVDEGNSTGIPFQARIFDGNGVGHPLQGVETGLEFFLSPNQFTVTARYWFEISGPGIPSRTIYVPDSVTEQFGVFGIDYTYTPVPEPSTALLVGLGLTWFGVARSRRKS